VNAAIEARDIVHGDFRRVEPTLPGHDLAWLRAWRRRGIEQFMEKGFPTQRQEDWKYTDVRAIAARRFVPTVPPAAALAAPLPGFGLGGPVLVFLDGHYCAALSALPRTDGVHLTSVAQLLDDNAEEIEPWLGRRTQTSQCGFGALNSALMQDGALVRVQCGAALSAPIELLFIATGAPDAAIYVRNVIIAEAGSEACVVENYLASGPGTYLTNAVTEVTMETGARLEHYRIEREARAAYHIGASAVHVGHDCRYASHSVTLGGRIARHELGCVLASEGAECALNGFYAGNGRQHMDHATRIDHRVAHCVSREWYKGVLDDQARGVFSGRVVVHPGAQHTDAGQSNHNLLLSPGAEADSRPQFEIYADDVKCAHGAATGSLDPEALFYLRTRGVDEALARRMLIQGFAADVLARMRLAPVRAALERSITERWAAQSGRIEMSEPRGHKATTWEPIP